MSKEAKRFGRATFYKLWKDDNYAITIDGKKISIKERLNYIHDNLFRNGMVNKQWDLCLQQHGITRERRSLCI